MAVVFHSPHSPDLAPCDFFLFPRMNLQLNGSCFQKVSEIQQQSLTILHSIPNYQFSGASTLEDTQDPWKRTTLKVTTTTNNKGMHTVRNQLSPENFQYALKFASQGRICVELDNASTSACFIAVLMNLLAVE
jgi:hypothetical protein